MSSEVAQPTALSLDLVPEAIVVLDDQAVIVAVNRDARELFGYSREELVGKPLELLVPERPPRAHSAQIQLLAGNFYFNYCPKCAPALSFVEKKKKHPPYCW